MSRVPILPGMTLRDYAAALAVGVIAGAVVTGMFIALVYFSTASAQTNEPPEAFLSPVVHQVLAECTYTNQTYIGREMCWKARFRDTPEFQAALKDAGWRLVRLWFAGELKEIEGN